MNVWHNAYSIFNNFPTITNRAQFRWFTEIFQYRCSKNGLEFAANFALTCIRCINCLSCRTEVCIQTIVCFFACSFIYIFSLFFGSVSIESGGTWTCTTGSSFSYGFLVSIQSNFLRSLLILWSKKRLGKSACIWACRFVFENESLSAVKQHKQK